MILLARMKVIKFLKTAFVIALAAVLASGLAFAGFLIEIRYAFAMGQRIASHHLRNTYDEEMVYLEFNYDWHRDTIYYSFYPKEAVEEAFTVTMGSSLRVREDTRFSSYNVGLLRRAFEEDVKNARGDWADASIGSWFYLNGHDSVNAGKMTLEDVKRSIVDLSVFVKTPRRLEETSLDMEALYVYELLEMLESEGYAISTVLLWYSAGGEQTQFVTFSRPFEMGTVEAVADHMRQESHWLRD